MRAIIVAAGRGRRLGPETSEIPKCMVAVGGRPILHRQLDALALAGVSEVVIVRGYLGERIAPPTTGPAGKLAINFIENPRWAENNILASLFYAEEAMETGFVFSYSDIVFARDHARLAAESSADIGLVVDRRWEETYVGRLDHPLPEAELTAVSDDARGVPRVTQVGKGAVPAPQAIGEFTGLARFSSAGARALSAAWHEALAGGLDRPYGRAPALRVAYLTDALNAIIAGSSRIPETRISPLYIDGRWREIDTQEDLSRAHALVDAWDVPSGDAR